MTKLTLISILILLTNLAGCVGYNFSKNGEIIKTDISTVDTSYGYVLPKRDADKTNPDGTKAYRFHDEIKWCGLTVWAIIPVPLWLPICRNYTEVTYKDKKPIEVENQSTVTSGGLCGPLVPMIKMERGYCQWHEKW